MLPSRCDFLLEAVLLARWYPFALLWSGLSVNNMASNKRGTPSWATMVSPGLESAGSLLLWVLPSVNQREPKFEAQTVGPEPCLSYLGSSQHGQNILRTQVDGCGSLEEAFLGSRIGTKRGPCGPLRAPDWW